VAYSKKALQRQPTRGSMSWLRKKILPRAMYNEIKYKIVATEK